MTAPLTIYPAIDLKAGKCVRLLHGRMDAATVYNDNPADQARAFADAGLDRLHIVDLDGAFAGKTENGDAVAAILAATRARAQLGGGVRSQDAAAFWFDRGVERVILGTAAVKDPDFVRHAARRWPGRLVVGLDALDGRVRTDGWAGDAGVSAVEVAKRFEDAGVAAIVYTDIGRDGALAGPNVEGTAALAGEISIPVIASGGVSSDADIRALAAEPAIEGVIVGRAFYEGRLSPTAATAAAAR